MHGNYKRNYDHVYLSWHHVMRKYIITKMRRKCYVLLKKICNIRETVYRRRFYEICFYTRTSANHQFMNTPHRPLAM